MRSSSSRPRRAATPWTRRGRARKAPAFHVSVFNKMDHRLPWERDWAELPADAISCILHKLDHVELLLGGVAAMCRSWRRAAREEPELWRRIDMRDLPRIPSFNWRASLGHIMRAALRLSAGQCHTFFGELLDDELFLILAKQAPLLKSLHLIKCYSISNEAFAKAIKKFPLLDELELSWCLGDTQVLQLVAKVCPGLKHFRLVNKNKWSYFYHIQPNDDRRAHAIAMMRGLRSLHLVDEKLNNEGLTVILDNCRHLEYLNMRDCCNINMEDHNLRAKCARINMDDYEYVLTSDHWQCYVVSPCSSYDMDYDDYRELLLSRYIGDDVDDIDLEEHEMILDIKRMRRYVR